MEDVPGGVLLDQEGAEDLQLACWPRPPTWGLSSARAFGKGQAGGLSSFPPFCQPISLVPESKTTG